MDVRPRFFAGLTATLTILSGCRSSPTTPGEPNVSCTSATMVNLEVGSVAVYDALRETGCLRLPGGAATREYLTVAFSAAPNSSSLGTSGSYALTSGAVASSGSLSAARLAADLGLPTARRFARPTPTAFDHHLRVLEHGLATSPATFLNRAPGPRPMLAPPQVGGKDSFYVCVTVDCKSFNRVGATVKYVGTTAAIYLDDHQNPGAEQLTQGDIDQVGSLFDRYMFAIDTTAFGAPSDVNGDGHVAILFTPAVNALTPDCSDGRIIGYTFGNDLLSSARGSNQREIFYAFAPQLATSGCTAVTRSRALAALPPVMMHELQHMISFNQHVLRGVGLDQELWLNEGLSHFAEELGYRGIPDAECVGLPSCFAMFMDGDLRDAYDYLDDPEATYLVAPTSSGGTLAERGAGWLFVRWLADHFSGDTLLGTQLTRQLETSAATGATRIAQLTGLPFGQLLGEWHAANWVDNLPGFPQAGRLRYRTWNFRSTFLANYPDIFAKPYPLTPDSTAAAYSRSGTLRAGSGRYVRFILPAGSADVQVRLAGTTGGAQISSAVEPRIAVVRIK